MLFGVADLQWGCPFFLAMFVIQLGLNWR